MDEDKIKIEDIFNKALYKLGDDGLEKKLTTIIYLCKEKLDELKANRNLNIMKSKLSKEVQAKMIDCVIDISNPHLRFGDFNPNLPLANFINSLSIPAVFLKYEKPYYTTIDKELFKKLYELEGYHFCEIEHLKTENQTLVLNARKIYSKEKDPTLLGCIVFLPDLNENKILNAYQSVLTEAKITFSFSEESRIIDKANQEYTEVYNLQLC